MSRKLLLPESVLDRMGVLLGAIRQAEQADEAWHADARIHVLRNYTTEPLDPYLKYHLLRDDIRPEISHGGYGTIAQELLDPDSPVVATPPEAFVLSLLVEFIDPAVNDGGWTADVAMRELTTYTDTLIEKTSALIIANTFIPPIDMLMSAVPDGIEGELVRLNEHLLEIVDQHADRVVVCDWRNLPGLGALDAAIDKRFWRSSDAPFRAAFLDLYGRRIASYIRAIKGFARKCLILDCDDTLWGGIVGEVGLDGLKLDDASEPGFSFRRFQREIVRLHERGVMVALCSKNNEEDVWNVFEHHEHMLLNKSHLVAWRINWEDKASNIDSIVAELNIGMDSVVFVDDSPRERALITDCLPEISVIEVPEGEPASPELLLRDCFFETISQTVEDVSRTRMYQEQEVRSEARQRFSDLSDYLQSLQTVVRISEANEDSINRVTQLTQKTNQFNLTTRRYTEAEIRDFVTDPQSAVFKMAVSDRFGDMGITGVLIADHDKTSARIDTLLLSCRVLGRQLEVAFVDHCMQILEARWPISVWQAEFVATRKNQQTADFWDRMGFEFVSGDESNKHYASRVDSRNVDYLDIMTVESE
jgi:FkbH-like protein